MSFRERVCHKNARLSPIHSFRHNSIWFVSAAHVLVLVPVSMPASETNSLDPKTVFTFYRLFIFFRSMWRMLLIWRSVSWIFADSIKFIHHRTRAGTEWMNTMDSSQAAEQVHDTPIRSSEAHKLLFFSFFFFDVMLSLCVGCILRPSSSMSSALHSRCRCIRPSFYAFLFVLSPVCAATRVSNTRSIPIATHCSQPPPPPSLSHIPLFFAPYLNQCVPPSSASTPFSLSPLSLI